MTHVNDLIIYPQIMYEAYINGSWVDISNDVLADKQQTCEYGIMGNGQADRVATTGTLKFMLRNDSGCTGGKANYYSPGSANARVGWNIGIPVRLSFIHDGDTVRKFYGHVGQIKVNTDYDEKSVEVTALDWVDYATKNPVLLPAIQYDKTMDEVAQSLVEAASVQPLHATYHPGQSEFNTAFDTVRNTTKIIGELGKLANSELGYVYIKRDWADGETFVSEGRYTRSAATEPTHLPGAFGWLLKEDGDFLLKEDGYKIILNTTQLAVVDNLMTSLKTTYGENVLNRVICRYYPRRVDTAYTVLYSLNSPQLIAAGETISVRGAYVDSVTKAQKVNGTDMQIPASTTDYQMWQNANSTGVNRTASLDVVANYGTEAVEYTLTNNNASASYITKLQARGIGIYIDSPLEVIAEDSGSISTYGYNEVTLDMKYQDTVEAPTSLAAVILAQDSSPRTQLTQIDLLANTNNDLMHLFLYLDIGDLVQIIETNQGIDNFYYINGIKFTIKGKAIYYSWVLKDALTLNNNYWQLEVAGKSELGITTILGY